MALYYGMIFYCIRDYIYRSIPISSNPIYTEYREEIVMDKKTFVEAFERWIEKRA